MLNLAYLFDLRPEPLLAQDFYLYIALMGLFAAGLGVSLFSWSSRSALGPMRSILLAEIPLCTLVLGSMTARLLSIPFLSVRALFYGATLASASWWAIYLLGIGRPRGWLRRQLSLLTFSGKQDGRPLPPPVASLLLGLHLLGLMLLAGQFERSWFWMVGLFVLLLSPQLLYSVWARKWVVYLEALTPLGFAYLAAVARRLAGKLLIEPLPLYDGFAHPDLWYSLLNAEAIFAACVVYALLCEAYVLLRESNRLQRYVLYVAASLLTSVFIWAGAEYFLHRTHGVTANDPYAYAQMAVDIAGHGHPLHRFTLFPDISTLGISWWSAVHYGYQVRVPPLRPDGSTATDWPAGWPVILSIAYLVLGETGLYISSPIIALLCLGGVVGLVAEVLHDRPWGERLLGGACAALILATSYEQVDRLLVPMADASAQLFTILTLFLILRAMRGRHRVYAILAGCCFGWAYFVRHTQLVLGLCAVVAVLALGRSRYSRNERLEFMGLFSLSSLAVALPDLLYHRFAFGHLLTPESTELGLFKLGNVPATASLMWKRFLSGNEFGYLSPLILYGAYRMYLERRGQLLVLLTGALGVLLVQLPYAPLRLRDLLSVFPLLLTWSAYGTVDLWSRATLRSEAVSYRRHALGVAILLLLLVLPLWRTWSILPRPWGSYRASFGYVSAQEREAFDLLAKHTLEGSVVGSSLNGGPIDLYAGREAYRPAFWTEAELDIFFNQMFRERRATYILDDGDAVRPTLQHAKENYEVVPIAQLSVPIFGDPQQISRLLYQIRPLAQVAQ